MVESDVDMFGNWYDESGYKVDLKPLYNKVVDYVKKNGIKKITKEIIKKAAGVNGKLAEFLYNKMLELKYPMA